MKLPRELIKTFGPTVAVLVVGGLSLYLIVKLLSKGKDQAENFGKWVGDLIAPHVIGDSVQLTTTYIVLPGGRKINANSVTIGSGATFTYEGAQYKLTQRINDTDYMAVRV